MSAYGVLLLFRKADIRFLICLQLVYLYCKKGHVDFMIITYWTLDCKYSRTSMHVTYVCTYTLLHSDQAGGWSHEGVTLDIHNSNETTVTCFTTHLTSFAVLVTIQDRSVSIATIVWTNCMM